MIDPYLLMLSSWVSPYLDTIAFSFVASILVIYGTQINKSVQSVIAGAHFLLRTLVFIVLCSIGLGVTLSWGTDLLAQLLKQIPSLWLGLLVILSFMVIGWQAEKTSR